MESCDWNFHIRANAAMLRIMGMWPGDEKVSSSGFYTLYTTIVVATCVASFVLFQIINVYFLSDNFDAIIGSVYILLSEIMAAIKVFYVLKNSKAMKINMRTLREKWVSPTQKYLIESDVNLWKRIYVAFCASCVACNVFLMIYPLLDRSAEERRLLFLSWYPYDYKISPFYEITYVYQAIGCAYLTLVHFNVDTIIASFNVYTGCQLDVLYDNLKNFAKADATPFQTHNKLIECIFHHKEILKFVEKSNSFYSWIIFWHLLISGCSIGLTMFQLTVVVPLSNEFYFILSYELAIILQIFMSCWFGNEIIIKSNRLSYALFESDWTNLPPKVKKTILIFTVNVTEPLQISALGVIVISLDTLTKILKTAWSYFALMSQLSLRN